MNPRDLQAWNASRNRKLRSRYGTGYGLRKGSVVDVLEKSRSIKVPNSLIGKSQDDYEEVGRDEYMEPITQITQVNYPQMSQISIVDDRDAKSPQT